MLAKAVAQPTSSVADTPSSLASQLLQGIEVDLLIGSHLTVGASLLAKALAQPTSSLADTPSSLASQLLQGIEVDLSIGSHLP